MALLHTRVLCGSCWQQEPQLPFEESNTGSSTIFVVSVTLLGLISITWFLSFFFRGRAAATNVQGLQEEQKAVIVTALNKTKMVRSPVRESYKYGRLLIPHQTLSEDNIRRRRFVEEGEPILDDTDDETTEEATYDEEIHVSIGENDVVSRTEMSTGSDKGKKRDILVTTELAVGEDIESGLLTTDVTSDSFCTTEKSGIPCEHEQMEEKSEALCLVVAPSTNRVAAGTCAICLESYKAGDEVSLSTNSDCLHVYHTACILGWLLKLQPKTCCPCCRLDFLKQEELPSVQSEIQVSARRS